MEVTVDSAELERVLKQLRHTGQSAQQIIRRPLEHRLMKIEAEAVKRAPNAIGTLRGSSYSEVQIVGKQARGTIQFGGMASAYGEVQHERDDFAHTESEYATKYGRPLNRNGYTRQTLRGTVSKRGKLIIKAKTWKYKRKRKILGYKGGQAHFLHGRPDSAWTPAVARALQAEMLKTLTGALNRSIAP